MLLRLAPLLLAATLLACELTDSGTACPEAPAGAADYWPLTEGNLWVFVDTTRFDSQGGSGTLVDTVQVVVLAQSCSAGARESSLRIAGRGDWAPETLVLHETEAGLQPARDTTDPPERIPRYAASTAPDVRHFEREWVVSSVTGYSFRLTIDLERGVGPIYWSQGQSSKYGYSRFARYLIGTSVQP